MTGNGKTVLYKQVVEELKRQIISGKYKNGELLPSEKELIDSFGVSRITIRKALAVLADMGYIQTSQGKGSEVIFDAESEKHREGFKEAIEEYRKNFMASTQIRLMLEPEVARQVAMTATDEQMERFVRESEEETVGFHKALFAALENETLCAILHQLMLMEGEKVPLDLVLPENYEKVSRVLEKQHQSVMHAICERNGEFAYFYMKEHMQYIAQIYEDYFEMLGK